MNEREGQENGKKGTTRIKKTIKLKKNNSKSEETK